MSICKYYCTVREVPLGNSLIFFQAKGKYTRIFNLLEDLFVKSR